MTSKDSETIEASSLARLLIVGAVLLMVVLILLLVRQLEAIQLPENAGQQEIDPAVEKFRQLIDYFFVITLLFSSVFSIYSFRFAWRTRRSGRYPPPGALVIRKTPVIRGDRAKRLAIWFYVFALLIWLSVLVPVFLRSLLDSMV